MRIASPALGWAALAASLAGASTAWADAPPEDDPRTDHERWVGRLALGFEGTRLVPGALPDPNGAIAIDAAGSAKLNIAPDTVLVPMFGLRYWITRVVGVDLGVGFNYQTGTFSRAVPNPNGALDRNEDGANGKRTAVAVRLAAPLAVHSGRHYALMVIPELDVGYSSMTVPGFSQSTAGNALDLRLTGLVFGAGGRVGAELTFGFWGVPQLSIQSSWGLRFESRRRKGKIGDAEMTLVDTAIGTSFQGEPWQWLTGSLGVYYSF